MLNACVAPIRGSVGRLEAFRRSRTLQQFGQESMQRSSFGSVASDGSAATRLLAPNPGPQSWRVVQPCVLKSCGLWQDQSETRSEVLFRLFDFCACDVWTFCHVPMASRHASPKLDDSEALSLAELHATSVWLSRTEPRSEVSKGGNRKSIHRHESYAG